MVSKNEDVVATAKCFPAGCSEAGQRDWTAWEVGINSSPSITGGDVSEMDEQKEFRSPYYGQPYVSWVAAKTTRHVRINTVQLSARRWVASSC